MTIDANGRNHQPGGVPVGGQFATEERDDTAVLYVESDEQYDEGATFYFPNPPRSPQQMIQFWSRIPVPDPALGQLRTAFAERAKSIEDQWVDKQAAEQMAVWDAQAGNEKPVGTAVRGWNDRRRSAERVIRKDLHAHYQNNTPGVPKEVPTTDARAVARAMRMSFFLPTGWSEHERAEVLNTMFTTSHGKESVGELVKKYRLDRLADPFEEPTEAQHRILEQQTERLQQLIQETRDVADEVRAGTEEGVRNAEFAAGTDLFER